MDYFYAKLEKAADDLEAGPHGSQPCEPIDDDVEHRLRARLAEIMRDLAVVLHDVEWSDSGDYMPDAWIPSARSFIERYQDKTE